MGDFDCPLSLNGEREAVATAKMLSGLGSRVDLLVSSPAICAHSTAEALAAELHLPIQPDKRIYGAGADELLAVVRGFDDRHNLAALVGHDPGLSEFIRFLTDEKYADLTSSAAVIIDLPLKSWRHTFGGKGVLKKHFSPKGQELGFLHGGPQLRWTDRLRFWRFQRAQRLEIIMVLVIGLLLLAVLIPLVMHQSVDASAMPQQGSMGR